MTANAPRAAAPTDLVAPVGQIAFTLFDGSAAWGPTGFAKDGVETLWIGDRLPADAIAQASGGDRWVWVADDPAPHAGVASHKSVAVTGAHEHVFTMDDGLPLRRGGTIFVHVHLDPKHPPQQMALRFNQNGVWEHRVWWGAEDRLGLNGVHAGPLPPLGQWVRLEVPAAALGLEQASKRPPRPAVPQTDGARTLDLSGFALTFAEEFDRPLDVSAWGPGTRWIAHTPWDGDFGDARFADPEPGFPFAIVDGKLRIEARQDPAHVAKDRWKREWAAGLLSSCDAKGNGFAQQYGYFVMRARMPGGIGVWPAFWLVSAFDRTTPAAATGGAVELDVIEYYGRRDRYQAVVHVWEPKPHRAEGATIYTSQDFCTDAFRDYGVLVEPEWITMYTDGVAVWRTPTPPEHRRPLMLLINLALGSGWPIEDVKSPTYMHVEYVRAYARRG